MPFLAGVVADDGPGMAAPGRLTKRADDGPAGVDLSHDLFETRGGDWGDDEAVAMFDRPLTQAGGNIECVVAAVARLPIAVAVSEAQQIGKKLAQPDQTVVFILYAAIWPQVRIGLLGPVLQDTG